MDVLEFFASLVQSLAWPTALVVALYLMRVSVAKLFDGLARRIQTGNIRVEGTGWKASVEEALNEASDAVQGLPDRSPPKGDDRELFALLEDSLEFLAMKDPDAAVIRCWDQVESAMNKFARRREIDVSGSGDRSLIEAIERHADLDRKALTAARRLLAIRNVTIHVGGDRIGASGYGPSMEFRDALDYITIGKRLIRYFRSDEESEFE